jgi:hypothetical protein
MATTVIKISTNIAEVSARIRAKLEKLKDKDYLLRPVCFDLLELMKKRIHEDGKNAAGSQIGTYSKGYLALRQKKYKRSSDAKVIVSLTRQLENDWSVIATTKGYGIGFKNDFNLKKARWVEVKKGIIFSLTTEEEKYARDYLTELINQALAND